MTQPTAPDWSARLALSVAAEVRRHRQRQGLSAQQLADRCAAIGMPIQRSVLANLESGRRTTVTLAEVFVLAYALKVPPGVLMFPVGYKQQVEVLPAALTEPEYAIDWLSGRLFFSDEEAENAGSAPLSLIRSHQAAVLALRRAIQARKHAVREADRAARDAHEHEFEAGSAELEMQVLRQRISDTRVGRDVQQSTTEEREHLRARYDQAVEQAARARAATANLRYTRQKLVQAEEQVSTSDASLREIRAEMKRQDLVPPLLPRELLHIDPNTVALEDVPEKKNWPPLEIGESTPEPGQVSDGVVSDEQLDLFDAASEADKLRIKELLDEMQPRLAETVKAAVEEALRRREHEEE